MFKISKFRTFLGILQGFSAILFIHSQAIT